MVRDQFVGWKFNGKFWGVEGRAVLPIQYFRVFSLTFPVMGSMTPFVPRGIHATQSIEIPQGTPARF